MSTKLDKSLDEIISTQRRSSGRGRGRRVGGRTAPAAAAPAGGVKKNPKHVKGAVKNIPTGPSGSGGEGKILVTGFVCILVTLPSKHCANLRVAQGYHGTYDQGMLLMRPSGPLDSRRTIPSSPTPQIRRSGHEQLFCDVHYYIMGEPHRDHLLSTCAYSH